MLEHITIGAISGLASATILFVYGKPTKMKIALVVVLIFFILMGLVMLGLANNMNP
jgi:precorrin-2 methylase